MAIISEATTNSAIRPDKGLSIFDPRAAVSNISDDDWRVFNRLTSVQLSQAERDLAARPDRLAPEAHEYLAVHWHPEWAPLGLISLRLERAFPKAADHLTIPTQHNRIMSLGPWAGVEADVYDRSYGLKVQLLIHFQSNQLHRAGVLTDMMNRTYNYRAHQLMDILNALAKPDSVNYPGLKASICDESLLMARFYALRLKSMIEESGIMGSDRDEMLKNRLLPDFILGRACNVHQPLVDQAIIYINAVKKEVKKRLSPEAFYSPQEVIEEARGLKAGIVIPHPPQFWPILLADLDVDGWEIWNPSTPDHALFLLEALNRVNESRSKGRSELLAFMGDDTHMSAKFRHNRSDAKGSAQREIGFQDLWNEPEIKAALDHGGQSLHRTISEYRRRMS